MKFFESISTKLMHGIFFVLMLMSIFLYKERMFADASYYLFHAINTQWFHVEHGRTVLALSQILPVLGTWLHLPLKVVLILASLGHEVFYYSVFLVCLYLLKDKQAALGVLAVHVIGQLWLYWSPMLEICYGAALAVLFYSILQSGKWKDDKWIVLLLVVQWFAMMSHPENFLLIGVGIAYHFLKNGFQKRIHLTTGVFTIVGVVVEVLTFSDYEKGHSNIVSSERPATALNLLETDYLGQVTEIFTGFYFDLIALFAIAVVFMLSKRRWLQLLLLLGSILFLVLLVNQANTANEFSRYNESMYSPLVFIVVFFFLYEVVGRLKGKWNVLAVSLLLVISLFRIGWIYSYGEPLRVRSAQLERLVDYTQSLGGSKYLINKENVYFSTWANSIESLFYSALDGKTETVSLITSTDFEYKKNKQKLKSELFMVRRYEIEPLDYLNSQYFELDTGSYIPLNVASFEKSIEEYKDQLRIELLSQESLKHQDSTRFLIKIVNENKEPLPSKLEEQVFLSYHWVDEIGGYKVWDGKRTKIEIDVQQSHVQTMTVILPEHEGNFMFVPDLLIEGKEWFNLKDKFNLTID